MGSTSKLFQGNKQPETKDSKEHSFISFLEYIWQVMQAPVVERLLQILRMCKRIGQKHSETTIQYTYVCNYTPTLTLYRCFAMFPNIFIEIDILLYPMVSPYWDTSVEQANFHATSLRKWHDLCCGLRRLCVSCATFLESPLQNRSRHSSDRGWLTQELWWRCHGQELSWQWVIIGCSTMTSYDFMTTERTLFYEDCEGDWRWMT